MIRLGDMTPEDARAACWGWMQTHMEPAWPETRFANEWAALRAKDVKEKGRWSRLVRYGTSAASWRRTVRRCGSTWSPPRGSRGQSPYGSATRAAEVIRQNRTTAAARARAVGRGRVDDGRSAGAALGGARSAAQVGASHILASEGGVGKTFLLMELAMKIAAPFFADTWCGQMLNREHVGDGRTAVLITAEDDADELHIRMEDLDLDRSRRTQAGKRLLIVPLLQAGGAFPLVAMGPGGAQPSPRWARMLDELKAIPDLGFVGDRYSWPATLHGEENSALSSATVGLCAQRGAGTCMPGRRHPCHAPHQETGRDRDAPIQNGAGHAQRDPRQSNALLGAVRLVQSASGSRRAGRKRSRRSAAT
jgi:hypothetical protein